MDRRLAASAHLATRLGEVSGRAEGLAAAQEAAMLYRELAVKSRCIRTARRECSEYMSALGKDTP